jgi:hypothetical protein
LNSSRNISPSTSHSAILRENWFIPLRKYHAG